MQPIEFAKRRLRKHYPDWRKTGVLFRGVPIEQFERDDLCRIAAYIMRELRAAQKHCERNAEMWKFFYDHKP